MHCAFRPRKMENDFKIEGGLVIRIYTFINIKYKHTHKEIYSLIVLFISNVGGIGCIMYLNFLIACC